MIKGLGFDTGIKGPERDKTKDIIVAILLKGGNKAKLNIRKGGIVEEEVKKAFGENVRKYSAVEWSKENEQKLFDWFMK